MFLSDQRQNTPLSMEQRGCGTVNDDNDKVNYSFSEQENELHVHKQYIWYGLTRTRMVRKPDQHE